MATIKDIALAAGVSQGTVSNVLNGKSNVSSEKIQKVREAAKQLGYLHNEPAALLRKGGTDLLSVVMPDSKYRQYEDFYSSFKDYAQGKGFKVKRLYVNENSPASELEALQEARAAFAKGIVCISAFAGTRREEHVYGSLPHDDLLFIDRKPGFPCRFMGFDLGSAARAFADDILARNIRNVCLISGETALSCERDFVRAFEERIQGHPCTCTHIQTDYQRKNHSLMQLFNEGFPEAIILSNYGFAESTKDLYRTFASGPMTIYTTAPLFTMPEHDFVKYEYNYRHLGALAAQRLIQWAAAASDTANTVNTTGTAGTAHTSYAVKAASTAAMSAAIPSATAAMSAATPSATAAMSAGDAALQGAALLPGDGFRQWYPALLPSFEGETLNIVTLDSPEAYIMKSFAQIFSKSTGVKVRLCIYSYDEIYEIFSGGDERFPFDILRLDVTWLSWFADKLLCPLQEIEPDIARMFGIYYDGLVDNFARINSVIYALPISPSIQVLYYRRDLFEDPILKRRYYETYRDELLPPQSFEAYNRIARFFTREYTPGSPTRYGATLTLGSTGVAGSEFLTRLFSHQQHLYSDELRIDFREPNYKKAFHELIELAPCCGTPCQWWTDTASAFAGGDYAMSILFSNYASALHHHSSKIVGNIGYSPVPGGNPLIGGGSLGVSRYSRNKKLALHFIKWICAEPITSASAYLGSTSPTKATYVNQDVLKLYPWLSYAEHAFFRSSVRRYPEHMNLCFDERRFLSIIGSAVKQTYSGVLTPEAALANIHRRFSKDFMIDYRQ